MAKKAKTNAPPLMLSPAVCGFPSPAEQYMDAPLDLNELLVKNPPATYFVRALNSEESPFRRLHFQVDALSFSAERTRRRGS